MSDKGERKTDVFAWGPREFTQLSYTLSFYVSRRRNLDLLRTGYESFSSISKTRLRCNADFGKCFKVKKYATKDDWFLLFTSKTWNAKD